MCQELHLKRVGIALKGTYPWIVPLPSSPEPGQDKGGKGQTRNGEMQVLVPFQPPKLFRGLKRSSLSRGYLSRLL